MNLNLIQNKSPQRIENNPADMNLVILPTQKFLSPMTHGISQSMSGRDDQQDR